MIAPIIIAIAAAALRYEYLRRTRLNIEHHYLQMLLLGDVRSERYIEELSLLAGARTKRIAAEVVAELTPIIYRLDAKYIDNITHELNLGQFLLARCRHCRGAELIRCLSIISKIPATHINPNELAPYLNSKDRVVRLFALLATINADSKNILHHIANYPTTLTPFERSQLLEMLCQGAITVAYQPMLSFNNVNVKLLGITVVKHFGIEEAEGYLRKIVASEQNQALRLEALYTLASMQMLLCTPPIAQFVKSLSHIEHHRFLRYIASEGYAQSVVYLFSTQQETQYFQSYINSYKIKIKCL